MYSCKCDTRLAAVILLAQSHTAVEWSELVDFSEDVSSL